MERVVQRNHGNTARPIAALSQAPVGLSQNMVPRRSANSRAAAPVLILLLGWRLFRWRGIFAACIAAIAIGGALWAASPSLRARVHESFYEIQQYRAANEITSIGLLAAFFQESLEIIAAAPILGHGTGTIAGEFRRVTAGGSGAGAVAADNPHNQTFAVAIQIGIVGALVLWAMWIAHILLFRGEGLATWIGPVVVVENIVSSTLYVFGVGVLGGMALRGRDEP